VRIVRKIAHWVGRVLVMTLVVGGLWGIAATLLTRDGLDRCERIEIELKHLGHVNEEVSYQNNALTQRIEALGSDARVIEDIAREELGMIRSDETIYLFPPEFQQQYAALP
jgi:cell division protein FtsB